MQTLLLDNFINQSEADYLISLYEEHKHLSFKFRDVYPLSVFENNLTQAKFLVEKLNAVTAPKEAIVYKLLNGQKVVNKLYILISLVKKLCSPQSVI